MDCPRPIKSVLPRFYPTWSSRTRPSMRSEGLGSRLIHAWSSITCYVDCPRPIKSVLPRFYPTWSSRTRPSMRSEGLGSRLIHAWSSITCYVDCPRPIKSVLPRFYPTWSSRTRPSMRSEGLGSRLIHAWSSITCYVGLPLVGCYTAISFTIKHITTESSNVIGHTYTFYPSHKLCMLRSARKSKVHFSFFLHHS